MPPPQALWSSPFSKSLRGSAWRLELTTGSGELLAQPGPQLDRVRSGDPSQCVHFSFSAVFPPKVGRVFVFFPGKVGGCQVVCFERYGKRLSSVFFRNVRGLWDFWGARVLVSRLVRMLQKHVPENALAVPPGHFPTGRRGTS